ncbi:MAG: epoxyqueuosine reductase [Geobacter sp.]|nr:epoxyqueuosine reductase [Geobacter sp.]
METMVAGEITRFIETSPANALDGSATPYFETPLVGFASLDDPLFLEYKQIIGAFHLTPRELFAAEFGAEPAKGTVICWILPVVEAARKSNRTQSDYPSREWSHVRNHGEALNGILRRYLTGWLAEQGYKALAPQFSPKWQELPETPVGRASTWSERHAAYAAGLGTFSLTDALITPKGIAHRCGSVITDLVLTPSPRSDKGYADNCLYYREGSCGACIGRCPVGAISFAGHDKSICCDYVYGAVPAAVSEKYGVKATGCGLCQTRVPCENGIPRGKRAGC